MKDNQTNSKKLIVEELDGSRKEYQMSSIENLTVSHEDSAGHEAHDGGGIGHEAHDGGGIGHEAHDGGGIGHEAHDGGGIGHEAADPGHFSTIEQDEFLRQAELANENLSLKQLIEIRKNNS
ncbi:hypothetical protein ACOCEA_13680 [Maribacter sp. CXY002]|uniref:hypothetical protein n=1 Tax=Maribacter luteocoastalis TaxID=3407671 RepID=UPI003B67E511